MMNKKVNPKVRQRRKTQGAKRRLGVMGKTMLTIMLTLALVLGSSGYFLMGQVSRRFDVVTNTAIASQVKSVKEEVEGYFESFIPSLTALTNDQNIRAIMQEASVAGPDYRVTQSALYATIVRELHNIQTSMPEGAKSVYVGLAQGNHMLDSGGWVPDDDYKIINSTWWQKLQKITGDQVAMVGAYEDGMDGALVVTMAVPIQSQGTTVGAAAVDIDLSALQAMLSKAKIGNEGSIVVFDSDNQIVYHPNPEVCLKTVEEAGYSDNMAQLLQNRQSEQTIVYQQGGDTYHGTTFSIPLVEWQILGRISDQEFELFTGHISTMIRTTFTIAILLTVAAASIAVLLLVKPIKKLDRVVNQLANGELDVEVDVYSNDELGDLAGNISHLVDRLKTYIEYIDEVSAILDEMGRCNLVFDLKCDYVGEFGKLKTSMESIQKTLSRTLLGIADAAEQVDCSANNMSSGAQSLAQGATEQASTIQELAASIQDLTTQSVQSSSSANTASENAGHIGKRILESNQQMKNMLNAMDNISRQSAEVAKIVKTVEDIAFQTNILALNAAVEASRAGSAGKGFAVVADEVRSLAAKSSQAAQNITNLIQATIRAVKEGVNIADVTATSLGEVAQNMEGVMDSIQSIAGRLQSESGALEQISTGIEQLSTVVQTNSATSEESAATAEELAGQVNLMKDMVNKFKLDDKFHARDEVPSVRIE